MGNFKTNAGYLLIDQISLNGSTYVLGYNPGAPASFVTWEETDGYFRAGHYFSNLDEANNNMILRALEGLSQPQIDRLCQSLLSPELKAQLIKEDNERNAIETIEEFLHSSLFPDKVVKALMNNDDFKKDAMAVYYSISHSFDNETLENGLAAILDEDYAELITSIEKDEATSLDDMLKEAEGRFPNNSTERSNKLQQADLCL